MVGQKKIWRRILDLGQSPFLDRRVSILLAGVMTGQQG
jgi:hypothetical protein